MLSSIFQDPKERTDFFIAIAVVALFGLFIGSQFIEDELVKVDDLEAMISQTDVTEVPAPILMSAKEDLHPKKGVNRKAKKITAPLSTEESFPIIASTDSNTIERKVPVIEPILSEPNTDSTTVKETITEIKDKTEEIVSNSKTEDKTIPSTIEKTPNTIAPPASTSIVKNVIEGKDCRIIVGSYRLKSSRDTMLKKLAKTDFQVVTYREKGLNIVAIHHICDKEALRSTVKTVREKFAKGAFITGK